jgi:hypothetical protein
MRHSDTHNRNQRSANSYRDERIEPTFVECRIQGHSSGRAGGISHQGLHRGCGEKDQQSTMDNNECIINNNEE